MLRTALTLAAKGFAVFPCGVAAKVPATAHGLKDATTDTDLIRQWWRTDPNYNIAVATGAVSKIFVIDVDGLDAEFELRKLEAEHGALPPSIEVITARGRHVYFRWPAQPIRNSAGKIAPGIDVRGDGGYVLVPPSVHPSGKEYAWSVDSSNSIAEAPAWLLAKASGSNRTNGNGATPPSAWRDLVRDGVDEGSRNDSIARLAGYLLRRHVDAIVALELLDAWNATHCRPPLEEKELVTIVDSIAARELKRRGAA
jgi:hypothetical protein